MTVKPLISICIPTYNGEKFLRECLDSILAQTFSGFEVIAIDDQSSDTTFSILESYAAKDSRIKIFRNERNMGLVENWNRCIKVARGDWIKFVFQDDLISPRCVEKLLAAITANNLVIACKMRFLYDEDITQETLQPYLKIIATIDDLFSERKQVSPEDYCQAFLDKLGACLLGMPTAVMLHSSIFKKYGFFNSNLISSCDVEYWTRICIHEGFFYLSEELVSFRIHQDSTSSLNLTFRNYRTDVLDNLIILHDILYHPLYAPLRKIASKQTPKLYLEKLFKEKKHLARAWVRWLAKDNENGRFSPRDELQQVYGSYPDLKVNIVEHVLWLLGLRFSLLLGKLKN